MHDVPGHQRLPGARAGLHDHVTAVANRLGDGRGHLSLSVATFTAAGQRDRDLVECFERLLG